MVQRQCEQRASFQQPKVPTHEGLSLDADQTPFSSVKHKAVNLLEYRGRIWMALDMAMTLDTTPKARSVEEIIENLYSIKTENF